MPITQKQLFDLDSLQTVTVLKGFTFKPPATLQDAIAMAGGEELILSMVKPLLENQAEEKAQSSLDGWHVLTPEGEMGPLFVGKPANEGKVNQMTNAIAKQAFGLDDATTVEEKQFAKDQAWQLILSTPKLLEALRKNATL